MPNPIRIKEPTIKHKVPLKKVFSKVCVECPSISALKLYDLEIITDLNTRWLLPGKEDKVNVQKTEDVLNVLFTFSCGYWWCRLSNHKKFALYCSKTIFYSVNKLLKQFYQSTSFVKTTYWSVFQFHSWSRILGITSKYRR